MLLDNFFKIYSLEATENKAIAKIEFNPKHKIYDGHFPGMPVVPGVCMMQMLKEIIEKIVLREIKLLKGDQIKFLAVIEPLKTNEFEFEINYGIKENDELNVTAELINGATKYFKFKGVFSLL